jgi:uncharacterized protein YjeT (DUF2065 family)
MNHSEFRQKLQNGQIEVLVDRNKAGFMYRDPNLLPHPIRVQQAKIRTLGFGLLAIGIVLFFFVPWWIPIIVLFVGMLQFPRVTRKAAEGVLEASKLYPHVFETAVSNGVISVREINRNL